MAGVVELLDAGLKSPAHGAFTTRAGGVSAPPWHGLNLSVRVEDEHRRVAANRDLLRARAGVPHLVFAQQVHGTGVAVVDRPGSQAGQGGVPGVDALVTRTPGLGVVVLAADCLPVLLTDPEAGVVAAAHAGRQGLLAGILQQTLATMAELGAQVSGTTAVIGPAAGPCCYEVPQAMADDAERRLPDVASTTRAGTPSIDLRGGAVRVLEQAGVADVRSLPLCTIEDERLYSYRRDGLTGRHAGVVWLSP